jgi:L-threonylcarbamoyladenylate synthase
MSVRPRSLDVRSAEDATLAEVVEHLRGGGLIAYPTETVYGLGGGIGAAAVARVRALKSRERGKPLIALVPSAASVSGLRWTGGARDLARVFWPGALTLVLEDPLGIFPPGVRDEDTHAVGVRVSPHPLVTRLLERLGSPLTSTSLNAPGEPPALSGAGAAAVVERLGAPDVLVLDGGTLGPSEPSSIVDCTGPVPVVLREGAVPKSRLRCAVPDVRG